VQKHNSHGGIDNFHPQANAQAATHEQMANPAFQSLLSILVHSAEAKSGKIQSRRGSKKRVCFVRENSPTRMYGLLFAFGRMGWT
jgi:hypothetical protein